MADLVSVVVPCHNYARFLGECVASLLRQSHADWECIVVDDGSTDDTAEVCEKLARTDTRIRSIRQENRGVSAARNAGIGVARGAFLQFLDADDILEPDKLRNQLRFMRRNAGVDIVYGEAAFFNEKAPDRINCRRWDGASGVSARPGAGVLQALVRENICVMHAALLRRRVLDAAGRFDESLRTHEDWEFWLRCALKGCVFAFASASNDRAIVRHHEDSLSRENVAMLRTAVEVRERMATALPSPLRQLNAEQIVSARSRLGIELMRLGRIREGWRMYRDSFLLSRGKLRATLRLLLLMPGMEPLTRFTRSLLHDPRPE